MENIFINHTNHPSIHWVPKQCRAASLFGVVQDFPFPEINPDWDEEKVLQLARENCKKILAVHPKAVLCQGEFSYCYNLIKMLKEKGIVVLSACSKREAQEWKEGGQTVKKATFSFVRFRKY